MSFVRNSLGTLVVLIITAVLGFVWNMVAARVLEPQGVGILAVVILYPVFFFTIGHLTFNVGNIHHIGQRKYSLESFAGNSVFVALVMGALMYVIFMVTLPVFRDTLYKGVDAQYLYLAFMILPFYLLGYLLSSVLQGMGRIRDYNIVHLVRVVSSVVLLVLFIVALKFNVVGAVFAFVVSYQLASVTAIILVLRQSKCKWRVNFGLLWQTLSDGCKIHIGSIATFLYGYVGLMIANYYLSSAMVGYFNVALVCAMILFLIPQAVQTVLYPETAMATIEDAKVASIKVCRHAVFWVLIGAIVLGVLGKTVITLFAGDAFLPSLVPLLILLPGVVLAVVAQVVAPLWVRRGWFWAMGWIGVSLAVISITLNFLLIPRYGIAGASLASSLTYFVGFLIVMGVHFYKIDRRVWQLIVPQVDDLLVYKRIYKNACENPVFQYWR